LPAHEPYGARRPELAVNIRIPTLEALLAQIDLVLHADVRGFEFRMASAFTHASFLLNIMTAVPACYDLVASMAARRAFSRISAD
jgi:hypothetical protein